MNELNKYRRTHFNCAKIPLELILDSPLNENFFNDQAIMDLLKVFKSQEIAVQNNVKVWTQNPNSSKKNELYKLCLKLNKTLKCFYQCEECISDRNVIESFMDRLTIKFSEEDSDEVDDYFFVKPERKEILVLSI